MYSGNPLRSTVSQPPVMSWSNSCRPVTTMPLEPYEGWIEYMAVQYVVMGDPSDFAETEIAGVHIGIADSHPMTDLSEPHFVIELYPVTLKWTMGTDRDQKGKIQ